MEGIRKDLKGQVGPRRKGVEPAVWAMTAKGREALAEVESDEAYVQPVAPVLSLVPPLPDVDQSLAKAGLTWDQIAALADIATQCGVPLDELATRSKAARKGSG